MNLEEMREALASDATRKADSLEMQVKRLRTELRDKDKAIESYQKSLRFMFNRCLALTHGLICIFCGEREKCDELRSVGKKEE